MTGSLVERFGIVSVNTSPAKGTVKTPVASIRLVEGLGIDGDAHAGPGDRQVSLLAREDIETMIARDADVDNGDFAENITTSGIALAELPTGTRLHLGDAVLEISRIGKECHTGCAIREKIGDCIMPRRGVFARVIKAGEVSCESACSYRL